MIRGAKFWLDSQVKEEDKTEKGIIKVKLSCGIEKEINRKVSLRMILRKNIYCVIKT